MRCDLGKASVRGRLVASTNWGINRKGIWMWDSPCYLFWDGVVSYWIPDRWWRGFHLRTRSRWTRRCGEEAGTAGITGEAMRTVLLN